MGATRKVYINNVKATESYKQITRQQLVNTIVTGPSWPMKSVVAVVCQKPSAQT